MNMVYLITYIGRLNFLSVKFYNIHHTNPACIFLDSSVSISNLGVLVKIQILLFSPLSITPGNLNAYELNL